MDHRLLRPLILPALALSLSTCADPNTFLPSYQPGGPEGILGGTVTYSGPLPCTENHHVVGAAVFLIFDTRLLPPPEGLGTTAATVAVVGGDQLFGGVLDQLTFNADDTDDPGKSLWCPPDGTQITVSASWTAGAIPGGEYEVRGFYDLHGQFDPAFTISTLPHQGDIAGGAIDNVSAVLQGAAPQYRRVTLGAKPASGPCSADTDCVMEFGSGNTCQQGYCMPPQGAFIDGIAVTLGLPLATGLPIFNATHVLASQHSCSGTTVTTNPNPPPDDPTKLTLPSDYTLPVFNAGDPPGTEDSILRVQLTTGVAASEVAAASKSPFNFPVTSPAPFNFSWQDVNGDGMLDLGHDHVAASPLVPSLLPLSVFTKLAHPGDDLTAQSSPAVVLQGLTLYKSLLGTIMWGLNPPAQNLQTDTDVFVGITPAVLCLDPNDFSASAKAKLVVSHLYDCSGTSPLLQDQQGTINALAKQFGRPVEIAEACLPEGRYAMHLVYSTGQAWSVPNEAGVCSYTGETPGADGKSCIGATPEGQTTRARLPSQDIVLTISPPSNPSYCAMPEHQTPKECCPPLADPNAARVDPATGKCKCPSTDASLGCP